jgi:hypothetical protein
MIDTILLDSTGSKWYFGIANSKNGAKMELMIP